MYMAKLKDHSTQKGGAAQTVLQRSAKVFLKVEIDQIPYNANRLRWKSFAVA